MNENLRKILAILLLLAAAAGAKKLIFKDEKEMHGRGYIA